MLTFLAKDCARAGLLYIDIKTSLYTSKLNVTLFMQVFTLALKWFDVCTEVI